MDRLQRIFDNEPAMVLGVVQAGLGLAMGFGLTMTSEQMASVLAFTAALLALWTRSKVTPS